MKGTHRIMLPFAVGLWLPLASSALGAEYVIEIPSSAHPQHIIVRVPREAAGEPASCCTLVEKEHPEVRLPAQWIRAVRDDGTVTPSTSQLLASIPPASDRPVTRTFNIERGSRQTAEGNDTEEPMADGFSFVKMPHSLKLMEREANENEVHQVWQYNYRTITIDSLPEDNPLRSRSCYIHPVWGLQGETLTDDFPKDHYHHHGVFWTWPYVKVGDQTYDLWLSTDIRQQFVRWLSTETGPVGAVVGVENGWFVGQQQVATERVWLRTYRSEPDCRAIDISLIIEAGKEPVTLQGREEKSYGGFTFRFNVTPRTDATVRVPGRSLGYGSTGPPADPDLVNTRLPWADLTSRFPGAAARSGAAVFIDPRHPDYPPTWLTRTYGALCVGWPGVNRYTIAPGKSIKLDYRLWVHARELEPDELDAQYRAYCTSLEAHCR